MHVGDVKELIRLDSREIALITKAKAVVVVLGRCCVERRY
jgi:hypothetical protein